MRNQKYEKNIALFVNRKKERKTERKNTRIGTQKGK